MERNRNRRGLASSLLASSLLASTFLAGGAAEAAGESVHQVGKFRVRYETEGEHAVAIDDRNRDGVPDQAEDILTQVAAAHLLFVEALGFPDPFQTARFRSATVLDIGIRSRASLERNGLAYDELQRSQSGDWIGMKVASSVKATSNLTPAHEYFHLLHYGTSYFKNRWFAEGTARWSERALGLGSLGPARKLEAWPLPPDEAEILSQMAYEASEHFWNPLAARLDPGGTIPDSPALERLRAMRYADGSPVLKDLNLAGWSFIRDVVVELGEIDDDAFRELGYDRWSEANQFSPRNDVYILRAVERVVGRHENATPAGGAKAEKAANRAPAKASAALADEETLHLLDRDRDVGSRDPEALPFRRFDLGRVRDGAVHRPHPREDEGIEEEAAANALAEAETEGTHTAD